MVENLVVLFKNTYDVNQILMKYGKDILCSPGMQAEHQFIQHGKTTVYEHSVGVACLSVKISRCLHLNVDERALVRGALLHDYFLYDWHVPEKYHKWHGFRHPGFALKNARRDFLIGEIEKDIIKKHMFPLTVIPPCYKESLLVCIADKICALLEIEFCRKIQKYIKKANVF
ncbi:MAG: HD domain-containing protein [Lachnospiraceae bacterium]|nr:HD domain-containing protein [Lachnospiraceae bacterium]